MPANNTGPKIQQEKDTVRLMIKLYCRKAHGHKTDLCEECSQLQDYALKRLTMCRYGEEKPTCAKCPRHCYRSDYKQKIKIVMVYSGPRMMLYHPIHAVKHLIKEMKK
jgi:hypothetical protein